MQAVSDGVYKHRRACARARYVNAPLRFTGIKRVRWTRQNSYANHMDVQKYAKAMYARILSITADKVILIEIPAIRFDYILNVIYNYLCIIVYHKYMYYEFYSRLI